MDFPVRSTHFSLFATLFALLGGGLLLAGCDSHSVLSSPEPPSSPPTSKSAADAQPRAPAPPAPPSQRPSFIEVALDVKPGDRSNSINPQSRGVTPVAILHTEAFDPVARVDRGTLRFGAPAAVDDGGGAPIAHDGHVEDVDGDGDDDLVLHLPTAETGFDGDAETGKLVGTTNDEMEIEGTDSVRLVGPRRRPPHPPHGPSNLTPPTPGGW